VTNQEAVDIVARHWESKDMKAAVDELM